MDPPHADVSMLQLLGQLEDAQRLRDAPRSVDLCRSLLSRLDPKTIPDLWAALQGTLGDCLRHDTRGDPETRGEEALAAYEKALEVFTSATHPVQWAANNGNLGNLFMERRRGARAGNLKRAIHHYEQALTVFSPDKNPVDWASTHQSLGEAFQQGPPERQHEAIAHFDAALEVWTRNEHPRRFFGAHYGLATIFFARARAGVGAATDKALDHFRKTLQALPRDNAGVEGLIHEQMAHLHMDRAARAAASRADDHEQAIERFEKALAAYKSAKQTEGATRARGNLGYLYAHRERGKRADNVRTAIGHLEAVIAESAPGTGHPEAHAALALLYSDPTIQSP
jgi:tetratricopeptide (TPR) repeat protein